MARRRDWEALKEATRKRYQRYGITSSYYESGGTVQRARGHLPREHVTRRERNPLGFTSGDYRFLSKQRSRFAGGDDDEGDDDDGRNVWGSFQPFVNFYRSLSVENREVMRNRVNSESRDYKRRKGQKLRNLDEYISELETAYPWFSAGVVALLFYH